MSRWATATIIAGLMAGVALPAQAADLYEPPVVYEPIPAKKHFGGFYLRGYIGMTNQRVGDLDNVLFETTPDLTIVDKNFEAGGLFGGGIGYQANQWLRLDATAEYRGEAGFHGLDTWTDQFGNARFNNYTAKKSELLFLANAYVDLGNWRGVTPYVGAGIGASRNSIHSFRDMGIDPATGSPTLAYADSDKKWDFAWALHAGLGYAVTDQMTIDLGYSFVHLGDGRSGDIVTYDGTNNIDNPMHFKDITSHDFKLGVRYAFH
jgi:opacity protein-like surface antigen